MRLHEPLEQPGFFWLPDQDDEKVAGSLRVEQSGRVTLDLFGALTTDTSDPLRTSLNPSHWTSFRHADPYARIHGLIEGEAVTVDNCIPITSNRRLSGGVSQSTLAARRAYIGAWYDSDEPTTFSRIAVTIEGLHEWLLLSGLKSETEHNNDRITTITHTLQPPPELTASLETGAELAFGLSWSDSGVGPDSTEAKFTQMAYMSVRHSNPIQLDNQLATIFKFQRLLSLAVDRPVELISIRGFSPELTLHDREAPVQIYISGSDSLARTQDLHWFRMLFTYPDIAERFQELITTWFERYDTVGPAINLYDGLVSGGYRYIEGRFLATVQTAEAFHRRALPQRPQMTDRDFQKIRASIPQSVPSAFRSRAINLVALAKEQSLRQRLEDMMVPFQDLYGENSERLVKDVVDTRNSLAHTAVAKDGLVNEPKSLFRLQQRLEALIQLHLLKLLGFDDEEIKRIADKQVLKHKLS